MIQLFQGSIFNSKCDLIIIPCNNMGGVTGSIRKELAANDLPYLNRSVETGEVAFIQNTGKFANASMIGYAASVDACKKTSNENTLRKILRRIKQCCYEQSFQKINIPLLGTGAGGLSAKVSYDVMESEFLDDSSLSLCVYVISPYMYMS